MPTSSSVMVAQAPAKELDLRCPPLPQTLLQAVDISNQADPIELEQAVALVEKDPIVIARLLRVVNSAYYGQRGQVTNVQRAVLILGAPTVVGMVMSMSLAELRAALDHTTAVPFMNLVRHSVAAAYLAQHLVQFDPAFDPSKADDRELQGTAFTGGMLHDLGKLLLLYNFPGAAVTFYVSDRSAPDPLAAEAAALGYDHVAAGTFLARKLNLPGSLIDVMACHHDLDALEWRTPVVKRLVYSAACASKAANSLGYAFDRPTTWDACLADPFWTEVVERGVFGYARAEDMTAQILEARPKLEKYLDSVF